MLFCPDDFLSCLICMEASQCDDPRYIPKHKFGRHMSRHHSKATVKCKDCLLAFDTAAAAGKHHHYAHSLPSGFVGKVRSTPDREILTLNKTMDRVRPVSRI
ncbi:hypothetical protein DAI22_12g039400 [Oryza sativa Japonica Group]|nr:hypothetical protein DAI22_12g039400 [Oryza sativa Japonica Group]